MNSLAPASRQRSALGSTLAVLLMLMALAAILAFAAVRIVEQRVSSLLGPRSQVGDVQVGFRQVVLTDVVVPGASGQAEARAKRIVLEPKWSGFLRHEAVFNTVTVEGFDFAVVRTDNGDMQIAPALKTALQAGEGRTRGRMPIDIAQLVLRDGRLDFVDAAVATPAHRIPFKNVRARLSPVMIPGDSVRSNIEFAGDVEDNRNGESTVRAQGWVEIGGTDSEMKVAVRNMDIRHAAPYLAENGAGTLTGGAMDLDMSTAIAKQDLRASGVVALRGLKFSGDGSVFSLPRKAVLAAMKDKTGALRFEFALRGSLDNPKFSVTRGFAAQVAQGFSRAIGVGAEGAAQGVTGAVKELGDALSDLLSPSQ